MVTTKGPREEVGKLEVRWPLDKGNCARVASRLPTSLPAERRLLLEILVNFIYLISFLNLHAIQCGL
jgi:hypothetical protein